MRFISFLCCSALVLGVGSCANSNSQSGNLIKADPKTVIAEKFAYPLGKSGTLTQAKDSNDEWYNAQDFGINDHLGEDWNKNSGGDTDCGEPVFAVANGRIVFAEDAGPGWGNVVIVEHTLTDGKRVQSLYGHLQKILKTSGDVEIREKIGEVGNADGRYLCHLHFEIRTDDCPMWNEPGGGYSKENKGWIDPSDFIDRSEFRLQAARSRDRS
ncbi:MAG: M23 family metallopeptidase [Acidobacteria bacterium]|nr:M23 family metallopeptidase [Acidobacteriota bacterium]